MCREPSPVPEPWATLSMANWSSMLVPLPCYNHFPAGLLTSSLPFLPYIEDHAISCLKPFAHHCFPITLKTISNQDSRVRPDRTRRPCRSWSWVALTAPPQCSLCSGGNFLTLFLFFTFSSGHFFGLMCMVHLPLLWPNLPKSRLQGLSQQLLVASGLRAESPAWFKNTGSVRQ